MQALSSEGAIAENAVSAATRSRAAFDLKGVMSSLTVLRLRSRDLNLIERQLRAKVTQFPQFFQDAPVVLDLGGLEGGLAGFPLAALVRALGVCRVVPVALTNVEPADRTAALSAGLGIVTLAATRPVGDAEDDAPAEPAAPAARPAANTTKAAKAAAASPPAAASAPAHRLPVVVRQAVRSGQVVYAENTDLIVLGPVNPGAQLIADGNIHVYAALRGRAVAGASGYADARIFCQKLEAELIAINGAYVTFDDIPPERRGRPVQAFLQNGECVLAPL